jgi:hypothetical protein
MSSKQKIFIPTYISDVNYNAARVLPRIFFYNGLKECEDYYISSGSNSIDFTSFPYFDNYSGQVTTTSSLSLLFNNEVAPYGDVPTASLYTQYWENYVELLYNPRTRLLNASAIIPLADYFQMELNDIVEFRGNYYHLRAINDYNLKNGECTIQLLGPILDDAFNFSRISPITPIQPTTTTTTTSTTTTTTTTSTTTTTTTTAPPFCDIICVEAVNNGEDYQGGGLYQLSINAGISCTLSQNITVNAEIQSSEAVTTQLGVVIPAGNLFASSQTTYQNQSGINDTTWGDACIVNVIYSGPETLLLLNECNEPILTCPTASTYCYEIETIQSAPGECFDCPGNFFTSTDTIITFFDDCSGSIIPAPFNINVEALYSDNSTGSTFIPLGTTGSILIAFSDVQCAPLPECGEIASPTFVSASVIPVTGTITECCI